MESNYFPEKYLELNSYIHQAALNPFIDLENLNQICDVSKNFKFSGLCTNLSFLEKSRKRLGPTSPTKLIATISFPFGQVPNFFKKQEAEWAADKGAEALDVVPNFFALLQGEINQFAEEIAEICELSLPTTVILNTTNISQNKLKPAIEAAIEAGVTGIQTSNGFGPQSTGKQIEEITKIVRGRCDIKAVGGIKNLHHSLELLEAGATLIGTSWGFELMKELKGKTE